MKKMILLLVFIPLLFGCPSDSKDKKTTYQIINNSEFESDEIPELNGSIYDVIVYCFEGSSVIQEDNYDKVAGGGGKSAKKEVSSDASRVKISFKLLPSSYNMSSNKRYYTVSYTTLEEGKNNIIYIEGDTKLQETLKSSTDANLRSATEGAIDIKEAAKRLK